MITFNIEYHDIQYAAFAANRSKSLKSSYFTLTLIAIGSLNIMAVASNLRFWIKWFKKSILRISVVRVFNTYRAPANPAALFWVTTLSGGLHMIMTSWSDIITTPGNLGNHTRTLMKPCMSSKQMELITVTNQHGFVMNLVTISD